jgi:hypothetical protein
MLDHLTLDDKRHIQQVLLNYAHVFHDEESNDFKGTNIVEHQILVGEATPNKRPPDRTPYALRQKMKNQVQKMVDKGFTRGRGDKTFSRDGMLGVSRYVLVYSKSAEHAARLVSVLRRFDEASLQLRQRKCAFSQPHVQYLGFVLSENGMSAYLDKVNADGHYPTPKNEIDVTAYLGLASVYWRLVPNFAQLPKPLNMLTREDREFSWCPSQQKTFDSMKDRLCTTPVLAHHNFKLPFILTTDVRPSCNKSMLNLNGQ